MKVTVTALKAPWPAGTAVGDCVELPFAEVPAYFTGKCTPAPDDANAKVAFVPEASHPEPVNVGGERPAPSEDVAIERTKREEAERAARELSAQVGKLMNDQAVLNAEIARLTAELEAATAPKKK